MSDPEAAQLSGGLTNAQLRNASVVNSLHELYSGVAQVYDFDMFSQCRLFFC